MQAGEGRLVSVIVRGDGGELPSLRRGESRYALDDLIVKYERATGLAVDRDALAFYRVFIELKMLVVLLTGPSRGYVRRELDRLGIPHRHVLAATRDELANLAPREDLAAIAIAFLDAYTHAW